MSSAAGKRKASDVEGPNKKPHLDGRLCIARKYRDLAKLELSDLTKICNDLRLIQYQYVTASAVFQFLSPQYYTLQLRFLELRRPNIEEFKDWLDANVTKANRDKFKVVPKTLAAMSRTMRDIREASTAVNKLSVAIAAAWYEASAIALVLSNTVLRVDEEVTVMNDAEARFDQVLSFLENAFAAKAAGSSQANDTTQIPSPHQPSDPTCSSSGLNSSQQTTGLPCSSADLTSTDPRSDDYLLKRAAEIEVDLNQINVLPWDEVYGMEKLKEKLDTEIFTVKNADSILVPSSGPVGVLLHGPNGTGKSCLVYAFAKHYGLRMFEISPAVKGSLQGETEKIMTHLFTQARQSAPCILFFDEAEGILREGQQSDSSLAAFVAVVKKLWSDLLASEAPVFIFAASISPWEIPKAGFNRHFNLTYFVGLPDFKSRFGLIKSSLPPQCKLSDDNLNEITVITEGFSGCDIKEGIKSAIKLLVNEIRKATAWRKVMTADGQVLYPAPLPVGEPEICFTQLSEDEKARVRPRPLNTALLKSIFSPDFADAQRRTVDAVDIERHQKWQQSRRG